MKQKNKEKQRNFNGIDYDYHEKQFKEPYRSTIFFCNWLEELGVIDAQKK